MPSKKRSNLSQYTKNAIRVRLLRSLETEKDREARLAEARERQAKTRALKNYNFLRARTADSRRRENSEERDERLTNDVQNHNDVRALQNDDQHQQRLESAKVNYERRSQENENVSIVERERIEEIQQAETLEQRQSQLDADRIRQNVNRMPIPSDNFDESQEYDAIDHAVP